MLILIRAADILGTDMDKIAEEFGERGLRKPYGAMLENVYVPYFPSRNIAREFQQISERIGQDNPFEDALDVLEEIYQDASDLSLDEDFEININDYVPADPGLLGGMLPQTPQINPTIVEPKQVSSIGSVLTPVEEALLLPEEKAIRERQRRQT